MKWEIVEKMIDAGFTAEQILKIYDTPFEDSKTSLDSLGKDSDKFTAAETEKSDSVVGQNLVSENYNDVIEKAISDGFKELTDALIHNNIVNSQIPSENDDDILAQIIAPKLKERK